jgi:phosphatidylserine/phosphatidylglycerophosphate/cardiolipin synthase-like enzyme
VVLPLREAQQPTFPVKVLGASAFWASVLEEVAVAKKTVFLGSYLYDNNKLQTKLLAALARGVKVEVLVDKVCLQSEVAPRAKTRLEKLKEAGGKIYLGSGRSYKRVFGIEGRPGAYHAKVVLVDSVVAFVGSPNHTNNSLVNGELALRITGATVAQDVYNQAWAEAQRVEPF